MHVMRQFSVSCLSKDNDFTARGGGGEGGRGGGLLLKSYSIPLSI